MTKEGTVLIVDDNRSILAALRLLLEKYFARVLTLPGPNALDATLREERVDVVLLDMNFTAGINTGNEGIYWLRQIRARRPEVQVVLFTAYADIDLAVQAMRDGAVDFVVKPWDNERLVSSLRNAYNLARSQREVKQLKEIKRELTAEQPMFWGSSPRWDASARSSRRSPQRMPTSSSRARTARARRCSPARFTTARAAAAS